MTFQRLGAATAATLLATGLGTAQAAEKPGFDPAQAAPLQGAPVEIVLLNDHLRSQIAYMAVDPLVVDRIGAGSGIPMNSGAGIVGGAIAGAIVDAMVLKGAKDAVRPAAEAMHAAQCDVSATDDLARTVEDAVRATPWGASSTFDRHVIAQGQGAFKSAHADATRVEIDLSYSMTPDYSTLVVSATVRAYAQALPGAPSHWQEKPAWADQLVVFSDPIAVPARVQVDIDKAVAEENARFAATGVDALIDKANTFDDTESRQKAARLMKEHAELMRRAQSKDWDPATMIPRRAALWTDSRCAAVTSALHADADELSKMFAALFAGQLPAQPVKAKFGPFIVPASTAAGGPREIVAIPGRLFVSRSGTAWVSLMFRYSWLPEH